MSSTSDPARVILHPTDFSEQSELAFAHALRVALTNQASLSLLHVDSNNENEWDQFPAVRETLRRWGLMEEGAKRAEVSQLGLEVEKVVAHDTSVVDAIAGYWISHKVDLMVIATEGRSGLSAWLYPSTAERVAHKTEVPTLFVPANSRGCVSLQTGEVTMDQVLVPVDHDPPSEAAIERGLRAIQAYGHEESKLTLLHVGPESDFPQIQIDDWHVQRVSREGEPVAEILATADQLQSNLLIMVTQGTDGFLDILRGTTTEQVLRRAPCPVLAVPANF